MKKVTKEINNSSIVNLILFVIFALATLYISGHHEPWRDEAQSWLMARDMTIIELIKNAPTEGHPILFHLLLKPFILLGYSYEHINYIPWIITLISSFIFIKKFPSDIFTKLLVLCTFPFLYFCPSFLRSYTLILLFMILIASLYKDRYKHPIIYGILLLFHSNIHLFSSAIVGILLLTELFDYYRIKKDRKNKQIIIGFAIFGLILFLLQLLGSNTSNFGFYSNSLIESIFLPVFINNVVIGLLSIILSIIFGIRLFKNKEYKPLIIYVFSIMILIFILTFFSKGVYIYELFTIVLIFVYWISNSNNRITKLLFVCVIITHLFLSIKYVINDTSRDFSSARETASFIESKIPTGSNIYCTDTSLCTSIIPYLDKNKYNFIDRYTNKEFTFINWNDYYSYNRKAFIDDNTDYDFYITSNDQEIKKLNNYEVLYKSDRMVIINDEKFNILKKSNE